MSIIIRGFQQDDIGQVVNLLQDVSCYLPDSDEQRNLANYFLKQEYAFACVATVDENVVAFGSVFIVNRVRGGAFGLIEDVVVDKNKRREGIGRKVIERLVQEAMDRQCFKVILESSDQGIILYKSLGFKAGGTVMKLYTTSNT